MSISDFYAAILDVLKCGPDRKSDPQSEVASSLCPPGSLPMLAALSPDEASPKGREQVIAGFTVYVTGDTTAARCVVVGHDIWGFRAGRHRQVCDTLADRLQCAVYLPDLFHGSPATAEVAPGTAGFSAWAQQWTPDRTMADLDKILAGIFARARRGGVGFVGFCWGTYVGTLAAASGRVRAVAHVHPSHRKQLEDVHKYTPTSSDALVGASTAPALLLTAGNDDERCKPGGRDEQLLRAAGMPVQAVEFAEMPHGWVIKGDTTDAATARDVARAVAAIGTFLDGELRTA